MTPWPRRIAIVCTTLVLMDQALLHLALRRGEFLGRPVAPYSPPLFNSEERRSLEHLRAASRTGEPLGGLLRYDADLGWSPIPGAGDAMCRYDAQGARIGIEPAVEPKPAGRSRLAVVGCSFTHGDEVAGGESWAARVDAARDDVDVLNGGVGGYGIDQALIRLRRDLLPRAPDEVWLGFLPNALPRVVSVYRPALRHMEPSISFKPRFELHDDGLVLVPNPAPTPADAARLVDDSAAFLAAVGATDAFVARASAAYAPEFSRIAHWSAVGRVLLTARERDERPRDADRMLEDPNSEPFRLAVAIAAEFDRECRARGAAFRFVVLPDQKSLVSRRARGGAKSWQALLDALAARSIAVADVTEALDAAGAPDDLAFWMPRGHYSPRANQVVADALVPLLGASTAPPSPGATDRR